MVSGSTAETGSLRFAPQAIEEEEKVAEDEDTGTVPVMDGASRSTGHGSGRLRRFASGRMSTISQSYDRKGKVRRVSRLTTIRLAESWLGHFPWLFSSPFFLFLFALTPRAI